MTAITMKLPALSSELTSSIEADPASIAFSRYSQNAVYSFTNRQGISRILRLTLNSHRSREEIEDEVAWICELYRAGLSVCAPVRQKEGDLIVSFPASPEPS